jgi:hypothetical protein
MDETGEAGMGVVDDDPLFAVLEIVERQQAAAQAALEGLAAERAALRQERDALARQVQALQAGVQGAVRAAVVDSLAAAATEGTAAVQAATRPFWIGWRGLQPRPGKRRRRCGGWCYGRAGGCWGGLWPWVRRWWCSGG